MQWLNPFCQYVIYLHILGMKTLKTLYYTLIHSYLIYCLPIWSCGARKSSCKSLFILQKKAIRMISNAKYNDPTAPLFKRLGVLPIEKLSIFHKCKLMHDFINNKLPSSFNGMWKRNEEINPRRLRNSNEFFIPRSIKSFEKFPLYDYQKLWNENCENDLLNSTIPRKLFLKTLKTTLLRNIE